MRPTIENRERPAAPADALRELFADFYGRLILPGDAEYDQARRVWNGMIDRYPAVIAQCADRYDVRTAIKFAAKHRLPVAVRGGGHNVAGYGTCDDGIVIDLALMNSVNVDREARSVRAGGGARWGDVDAATQRYGLVTPGGVVSDTGIAGLTLGGGFGYLASRYGLACDNLLSAELVMADGRFLTASASENPDLFWALRGGGGNFGVVTSFTYRLHEFGPEVYMMMVLHDGSGDAMKQALKSYRAFVESAPDEAAPLAATGIVPPGMEHFPAEIHGKPFVMMLGMYVGDPAEGERVYEPLRTFARPMMDMSGRMPYVKAQQLLDEDYPAYKMRYYWKSAYLPDLTDGSIDLIVEHARQQPSPYSTIDLWHLAGAVKEIGEDETAFSGRRTSYMLNPEANWLDPSDDQANVQWVRRTLEAMRPYSSGGRYLNFAGFYEEGEQAMRDTFGEKYARLAAIKRKYDPDNLFHLNQNVLPNTNGHE
ncbi:MAG TPA: FAD-binding oxidoreductase [Rhodothermales bacterium]